MVGLWEGEAAATVQVLAAVKDASRDYRPDPKSRSAWELAVHIATSDMWFLDGIERGVFHFDPEQAKQAEAAFQKVTDVVAYYQEAIPAKLANLRALSDEQLAEEVDFFGIMRMSRSAWIGFANNHSIHHRGQLSAHLRALGSKVPNIYGPSADAEPAPA
ncbi:MAG: DinB family protein [Gemmatimonadales bacterium]